ncbi:MAG: hypothetical protein ACHQFW_10325 [Chitinophagales bacterium]
MKKLFCFIFILVIFSNAVFTQAVGYQGKKFMVEIGYSPASNLAARYTNYMLEDDYYGPEDPFLSKEKDPILFKHIPKLNIEYVIFNSGSIVLRYNPFAITSNVFYFDSFTNERDLVGVRSHGHMFSIGYKSYTSATAAPLGGYFGVYGTIYSFNTEFTDSKYGVNLMPGEFGNFVFEKTSLPGLSVSYGVKNIFWDKMTLDISLEAGYFFKDVGEYILAEELDLGDQYYLQNEFVNPIYNSVYNTRAFFFAVPTVSIGYLAF